MDLGLAIAVAAGAAAAGFVQGLTGFAFGLVALSVWAWVLAPQLAGPLVVFASLIGQLMTIGGLRHAFNLRRVLPFIIAGLAGIPLGVVLLKNIDATGFRLFVGLVLVAYCGFLLASRKRKPVTAGGIAADAAAGFVGGVMGGMGGLSGPAPTLWAMLRGWKKDVQRAVYQSFNLAMHAATFVLYAGSGLVTSEALWLFAIVIPAMIVPALLGFRLYRSISETVFRRIVLALLAVSGAVLAASAVRDLLA